MVEKEYRVKKIGMILALVFAFTASPLVAGDVYLPIEKRVDILEKRMDAMEAILKNIQANTAPKASVASASSPCGVCPPGTACANGQCIDCPNGQCAATAGVQYVTEMQQVCENGVCKLVPVQRTVYNSSQPAAGQVVYSPMNTGSTGWVVGYAGAGDDGWWLGKRLGFPKPGTRVRAGAGGGCCGK